MDSEDEKVLEEISKLRTESAESEQELAKIESRRMNLKELEALRKRKLAIDEERLQVQAQRS